MALGQVFLQVLQFFCTNITPSLFYTHSFIYHQHYRALAVERVIKQNSYIKLQVTCMHTIIPRFNQWDSILNWRQQNILSYYNRSCSTVHKKFKTATTLSNNTKQQSTQGKHDSQTITSFTFQVDWNSDNATSMYFSVFCMYMYTGCFTTLGHNYRRWFPRSLWSKKFI